MKKREWKRVCNAICIRIADTVGLLWETSGG